MSRKDNEKKETKPRKTEETSIGREIYIRIGTFLTVDLFQPPEHIPIKRIDLLPIWVCKTSASVNATADYE